MRKQKRNILGTLLLVLQVIFSVMGMIPLIQLNMLPDIYTIGIAAILFLFFILSFILNFFRRTRIFGIILSFIICIMMGIVFYFSTTTKQFLTNVTNNTNNEIRRDKIIAVVRLDDDAETLQEAAYYKFGILDIIDRPLVDQTMEQYNDDLDQVLNYNTYDNLSDLLTAFNNNEVQSLIYNQAWDATIEELDEGFTTRIRILDTSIIETVEEVVESTIEVTQDPFIVYISGIDQFEPISVTGRSDVNLLAVVNPETYQVLLITTPRDYYIEFPGITGGNSDKLTHAGNFGVQASINALANLYDISIEHYVRLNFTAFVDVVDELGGVEVYSEQDFITSHLYIPVYEGYNYFYGDGALAFVRERFNLYDGDFQRGRNQQAMLTGIMQKAMSPAILTGYSGILSSLSGNMDMNFTSSEISELVKNQLTDNAQWNIVSTAALGYTSSEYCFTAGSYASVVIPDEMSVADIQEKIATILNGGYVEEAIAY
jgi:cell envelope-related function transcriptional attenuator common domain